MLFVMPRYVLCLSQTVLPHVPPVRLYDGLEGVGARSTGLRMEFEPMAPWGRGRGLSIQAVVVLDKATLVVVVVAGIVAILVVAAAVAVIVIVADAVVVGGVYVG